MRTRAHTARNLLAAAVLLTGTLAASPAAHAAPAAPGGSSTTITTAIADITVPYDPTITETTPGHPPVHADSTPASNICATLTNLFPRTSQAAMTQPRPSVVGTEHGTTVTFQCVLLYPFQPPLRTLKAEAAATAKKHPTWHVHTGKLRIYGVRYLTKRSHTTSHGENGKMIVAAQRVFWPYQLFWPCGGGDRYGVADATFVTQLPIPAPAVAAGRTKIAQVLHVPTGRVQVTSPFSGPLSACTRHA